MFLNLPTNQKQVFSIAKVQHYYLIAEAVLGCLIRLIRDYW